MEVLAMKKKNYVKPEITDTHTASEEEKVFSALPGREDYPNPIVLKSGEGIVVIGSGFLECCIPIDPIEES